VATDSKNLNAMRKLLFPTMITLLILVTGAYITLSISANESEHESIYIKVEKNEDRINNTKVLLENANEKLKIKMEQTEIRAGKKQEKVIEMLFGIQKELGEIKGQLRGH
jgi:hypothetical protein